MNKKKLVQEFIRQLEKEVALLKAAALATHEAATNEESQPENQYDTRALEASYLAGAQAQRVAEVHEVIEIFKTHFFRDFAPQDPIDLTALVKIELNGKKNMVFILPKGGGVNLEYEQGRVQIITPHSALGETLMGLSVGESADFEVGTSVRQCRILSIE